MVYLRRCGWGSATLYFAQQFPNSKVVGFSNSSTQKEYIETSAAQLNIKNAEVITGDITDYEFEPEQFDRVVSVEVRASTLKMFAACDVVRIRSTS